VFLHVSESCKPVLVMAQPIFREMRGETELFVVKDGTMRLAIRFFPTPPPFAILTDRRCGQAGQCFTTSAARYGISSFRSFIGVRNRATYLSDGYMQSRHQ
jgi:hypothetical protein